MSGRRRQTAELLQILSGKVYICADTVDHIFQVGRDSFFRRCNIPFSQSLHDTRMFGERVIDPAFQGIVDLFERIAFVPESLKNLYRIGAARQCTEQGMELTVQLHKFF